LAVDHAGEHRAYQGDGNQHGAEDRGDEHEVEYPHDGTPSHNAHCGKNLRELYPFQRAGQLAVDNDASAWSTRKDGKHSARVSCIGNACAVSHLHSERLVCLILPGSLTGDNSERG
jgi:hypothetical protein